MWLSESDKFRNHLLRLDRETRRMRFGMVVSDAFLDGYVSHIGAMKGLIYGYFADGEMHAAAELRQIGDAAPTDGESAFSVEPEYQNCGIGTALLGRVIGAARNRAMPQLYMNCLAQNYKMQRLWRKFGGELILDHGEVLGRVSPGAPANSPRSIGPSRYFCSSRF